MLFPKPQRKPKGKPGVTAADREVYDAVLRRDGGCVAPRIQPGIDPCRGRLTREHVRPGGGAMGMRRVTRVDAVVILCEHHHLDGWATSHKDDLRMYLAKVEPQG